MTELSPRAQQLLRRASKGGGPTEAQRQAVKRGAMAVGVASTLAAAATTKFLIVGLVLGAVGGGVAVAGLSWHRPAADVQPAVLPVQLPSPDPEVTKVFPEPPVELPPVEKAKVTPSVRRAAPSPPPEPPVVSTLALELEALDHAVRSVDAGQFEQGLLEARGFLHEFPGSELALEARVVEVLALCGLSRIDEAQQIVTSLPVDSLRNPAVRRLGNACVELPQ